MNFKNAPETWPPKMPEAEGPRGAAAHLETKHEPRVQEAIDVEQGGAVHTQKKHFTVLT